MGKTKVGNIRTMLTGFDDEKTLRVLISSPKNRMNYEVEAMGILIGEGRDGEKFRAYASKSGTRSHTPKTKKMRRRNAKKKPRSRRAERNHHSD